MVICVKINTKAKLAMLLTVAMLTGCTDEVTSSDDSHGTGGRQSLMLTVSEEPWGGQTVGLTRGGETLAGLQHTSSPVGEHDGFGLYSTALGLENKQVTWNSTAMQWTTGYTMFWPEKSGTPVEFHAYAPYESSTTVSSGLLTFTTPNDFDTDLLWAYYRATAKGNDGAVGEVFFYDFEDNTPLDGWGNSSTRKVVEQDGENKCCKVTNPSVVNPWECQVSVDFPPLAPGVDYTLRFKAKASTAASITANLQYPDGGYASRGDFGSASIATGWQEFALSTTVTGDHATRLVINIGNFAGDLYFDDVVLTSSDAATLTFRHALAKLSFGTIANTSTHDMLVTDIRATGEFYQSGKLNLSNGSWSEQAKYSPAIQTIQIIPNTEFIYVPAGGEKPVRAALDYMFIPGPQVTVSYDVYQELTDFTQLASGMFYEWNGRDGSATKTDNPVVNFSNNIGTAVNNGDVICGTSTVHYLTFADLTAYDKLVVVGTPGMRVRMLFNRLVKDGAVVNQNEGSNDDYGGLVLAQYVYINDDGYVVFDLQSVRNTTENFVHLNSIKNSDAAGTVTKILLFKKLHSHTVSGNTTLEQGKDKTFDLTVGINHQVVIED